MAPPEDGYRIAGMFLSYLGRLLLLLGAALLLLSHVLQASLWPMGGLLILTAVFMWAIGYALSLPP